MWSKIHNTSAFRAAWCPFDMLTIRVEWLFIYSNNVTSFHELNTDSVLSALFEMLSSYTQTVAERTELY